MAVSTQRALASHPSAETGPRWKHDAFLSFRGEDTRQDFTSHLYHELHYRQAIKTFKDDRELDIGSTISLELLSAIRESQLAIVVLSPHYASSTWCLDELTTIIESMEPRNAILPIFYEQWRIALRKVANLSGWDSKNYKSERELIEDLVKCLLLAQEANDVRFVGIWGMGGIGKTTIAKFVFQKISHHFEVKKFLTNVREVSAKHGTLLDLQKQLLSPMLKQSITEVYDEMQGTLFTKNCLSNKKVLLILDDVDHVNQLEVLAGHEDWFGAGSRVIITTRDERLLVEHGIELIYKMEGLNDEEALQLFSQNAFQKDQYEEGLLELSKSFVKYAKGLPLALKVLGRSLYKRGRAFFHEGKDKEKLLEILDITYDISSLVGISTLIEKSLLTISKSLYDNSRTNVEMHDLIQEMAWEIVRQESRDEPGRRSRLCHQTDIFHVFLNNSGTPALKGIVLCLLESKTVDWNCEAFSKMSRLRHVEFQNDLPNLKYVDLVYSENLTKTPDFSCTPNIKSLELRHCTNLVEIHPSIARLKRLERLDLSDCTSIMSLPTEFEMDSLKFFSVKHCLKLKRIPEFGKRMKSLFQLWLSGTAIEKVPSSIDRQVGLKYLKLDHCETLSCLPNAICNLKFLLQLDISGCSRLGKLPENIGNMGSLDDLSQKFALAFAAVSDVYLEDTTIWFKFLHKNLTLLNLLYASEEIVLGKK
ncbi:hypothetical protein ACLB2K_013413 [Fragaria x ananassa]